jgi:hypothetical protein
MTITDIVKSTLKGLKEHLNRPVRELLKDYD